MILPETVHFRDYCDTHDPRGHSVGRDIDQFHRSRNRRAHFQLRAQLSAVEPGEDSFRVGSLAGDYGLVVSDFFFSSQVQATIVWVVAFGHPWPVWIDYPDDA